MKHLLPILSAALLLSSCSSTTMIQSTPSGADVYMDGQPLGKTPVSYSDTKIVGSSTSVTLKKEGYADLNTTLTRDEKADVGAIIGGCFLLFPFLWTMEYNPTHNYTLISASASAGNGTTAKTTDSTADLIRLKGLLDQGAITEDEFTTLKVKILNNEYSALTADKIQNLFDLKLKGLLTQSEYDSQKQKAIEGK
ncbi:MAG: PEGA domain-containing protein [Flavobacteriales bacterium]